MPYKSDKIKIAGTKYDLRVKLTQEEKKAIKILSENGYSQRKLAAMFNCSKWTVQNILHKQPRTKPKQHTAEYWREQKRKTRQRKQELFLEGKIKINKLKYEKRNMRTVR